MTRIFILDDCFEGLPIRPVTKSLVENLMMDLPLSPAQSVDFGVKSAQHYRALKEILLYGPEPNRDEAANVTFEQLRTRILELEDALGNGPKLNALVRRYAPKYANFVHFHTSWDEIFGRSDEASGKDNA